MIAEIALDMFRSDFFLPIFPSFSIAVGESAASPQPHFERPPFLDVYPKRRVNKDF
jgi:hypothetical protein